MIIETIILKNKVTKLEIVAHYSGDFNYGLCIGESCYSTALEYNGNEYIVCINKDYKAIYGIANFLTEMIKFPFIVNRVTRTRSGYEIIRDSVCVDSFNKILQKDSEEYSDLCEIDFDLTTKNWDENK